MPIFKNLSITRVSILIASCLLLFNTLVIIIGYFLIQRYGFHIFNWLGFILMLGAIAFFINKYLLDIFIFRRIKLIYKIIHNYKVSKDEIINFPKDMAIGDVGNQVEEWMEETNKELSILKKLENYRREYIGNVSHELKTPVFAIQGYLHTLLDGGLNDPSINYKYLSRAVKNVERLQLILEDLEIINKFESDAVALEWTSFDIKDLVEEVITDLQFLSSDKNINLKFKKGAANHIIVYADKEQIRQVLNNLLENSIKYGKINGTTLISFYQLDENILVEVSDNGLGIRPEHIKHLFDRFYRADRGRSRKEGGSGLGLSIVKHIIEAHQQTIHVRSTFEAGSTFGFTLKKDI